MLPKLNLIFFISPRSNSYHHAQTLVCMYGCSLYVYVAHLDAVSVAEALSVHNMYDVTKIYMGSHQILFLHQIYYKLAA